MSIARALIRPSIAVALAIAAITAVPTAAAGAPPPTRPALSRATIDAHSRVTSSTGTSISVDLNATTAITTGQRPGFDRIKVVVRTPAGAESHAFDFTIHTAPVRYAAGKGYLRAPSSRLPQGYGRLDLAVTATGRTTRGACSTATGFTLQTPVTLLGRFFFATRSRGANAWGSVGRATGRVSLAGTLTRKYGGGGGCAHPPPSCVTALHWLTVDFTPESVISTTGESRSGAQLVAIREVQLGSAVTRTDTITATIPAPRFTGSGDGVRVSVTATPGSGVSGSAVLIARSVLRTDRQPCRLHGTNATETIRSWDATLRSNHLAVREQVYGTLAIPTTEALLERESS